MPQEQIEKTFADITASCAKVVSYYHLQNGISPIKRLYVKNSSDTEREGMRIKISSEPKFLLPTEITDVRIPRRTTAKFEANVSLSPLYMVALDKRESGEMILEVFDENDERVAAQRFPVELLAFNECDFSEDPSSLAAFVRRTAELNKLLNLAARKLQGWGLNTCTGYSGTRNNVRNHFAACYSVLADQKLSRAEEKTDAGFTFVSDHRDTLISGAATPSQRAERRHLPHRRQVVCGVFPRQRVPAQHGERRRGDATQKVRPRRERREPHFRERHLRRHRLRKG